MKYALGLVALTALGVGMEARAQEFSAAAIRERVGYLASDALAGRGSGTKGNEQAAKYIADVFAKAGLKPVGTKGYFQPFLFTAGVTRGTKNTLKIDGKPLRAGTEFEPAGISASGIATGPVVFAGAGIVSSEQKRDDYANLDIKDKIVVLTSEEASGPVVSLRQKAVTARDKGAMAVLLLSPANATLRFDESDAADAGLPIAIVKQSVGEALRKPDVIVSLTAEVKKVQKTSANIAGLIEGTDPTLKGEVVVVGAHMDHLGMGGTHSLSEDKRPQIHHGADDNASGTAGVLALAEYFAKNRPKRSVLFLCFSGEELGLLGSAAYVKTPLLPLEKTVAMVNLDMIGRLDGKKLVVVGSGTSPAWNPLLDQLNSGADAFSLARSESGFGSSDQQSFYNAGIPVLFFFTGLHGDYHRPSDTVEKINADGEAKVLSLVAKLTQHIADTDEKPTFVKIAASQEQAPARFRVSLGSIPDYAYEGEGVMLSGVRPGSAAEKAGLQKGDVMVMFGEKKIRNVQEYTLALGDHKPGDVVEITIKRGESTIKLRATLAAAAPR